jgi:membrane associated rhomboid family serine protease
MQRCPEHSKDLVAGPSGVPTCPICGSSWMTAAEVEALGAGALAHLSVETREDCGAFAKTRLCLDCARPLVPMRVGQGDGWVERCGDCERYWVDRVDRRAFEALARRSAARVAMETLDPHERRELAAGLAEFVAKPGLPVLTPILTPAQLVLAALGAPMLERCEGNRVPWMTWLLALVLGSAWAAGRLWPDECGPLEWAWHSHRGFVHLLTSSFVHFDVLHLLGNLAFLLPFGDAAEQRLRRVWVLAAFLVLGPATVLVQGLVTSDTDIAGASGAVSALVGASLVLQPRAWLIVGLLRTYPIRVPLLLFGLFHVGAQLAQALLEVPGLAWWGHLTGLALGAGLALCARRLRGSLRARVLAEPAR